MSEPTLYTFHSEGYAFRLLKELSAFDTDMPLFMADKLRIAFVRSDLVLTPTSLKYIISRLEAVDVNKLPPMHKKSVHRSLLFLYSVREKMQ